MAARPRRPGDAPLPRGRERLRRGVVRRGATALVDDAVRRDAVAGAGDRPVGAGAQGRLVVRRPDRGGRQLPDPLPRHQRGDRHRAGDPRRERRGGRRRVLLDGRVRHQPGPPPASRGAATATAASATRCASATSTAGTDLRRRAARHDLGRRRLGGRQRLAALRQARRADAPVPGVAPRPRHDAGRRHAGVRGPRRALLRRRRPDPQRRVDRHRVREQASAARPA